jgi:cytosine/adenosine deaminase-related metal-dependent hydrolase
MPVIYTRFLITNDGPPQKDVFLTVDELGAVSEISAAASNADADYSCNVLIPGFVNAHAHLELSHLRGLVPEREGGMCGFISNLMNHRFRATEQEQIEAMILADTEMFESGISAVGDISNTPLSSQVKKSSRVYYHTFVELLGYGESRAQKIMDAGQAVLRHFQSENLAATFTPHAPYSISKTLRAAIVNSLLPGEPLSIHMHESEDELEFCQHQSGAMADLFSLLGFDFSDFSHPADQLPMLYFLRHVPQANKVQLVHNTFTDALGMDAAMQMHPATWWCFCPSANLYITGKLPDMNAAFRRRYPVCIGTDSLASNKSLSVLNELKLIAKFCPAINFTDLIAAATISGARFLGIENRFGKIKPGTKPGLVMLTNADPDNPRLHDGVQLQRLF